MGARNALLQHLRVNATALPQLRNPSRGLSQLFKRNFSDEPSEVTDRVLNVIKKFQKVDPSKMLETKIVSTGINLRAKGFIFLASVNPTAFEFRGLGFRVEVANAIEKNKKFIEENEKNGKTTASVKA